MEAEIYYDICFEFVIGEKYSYSADAQCHETDPVFTANHGCPLSCPAVTLPFQFLNLISNYTLP